MDTWNLNSNLENKTLKKCGEGRKELLKRKYIKNKYYN
jgi:hypothetical protein